MTHPLRMLGIFTLLGIVLLWTTPTSATPILDARNDVAGGAGAKDLRPNNFWAQSYTATADGLLTRVDVQVGKVAGATGDVRFELRPLVGGLPTADERGLLFASSIPINDIPVISSLADPPPYVSVDVTAAGIHARPGEQFVISLRRSGGTPAAQWRTRPGSYASGTGFFRSLLNVPWSASTEEFGFQTWIDDEPTAPYKLRVDPAYDVTYRPGAEPSLTEGEQALVVGLSPEERPMMEYPLGGLPASAVVTGAYLELQMSSSSGSPRVEITGFPGDGVATFADATATGALLATTPPTNASSSGKIPLDPAYIASLAGHASHVGVRMRSLDAPLYFSFIASDNTFTSNLPPRLVLEYALPTLPGDYNQDNVVDGGDLLTWQRGGPSLLTSGQLTKWKNYYGQSGSLHEAVTAVPEPAGRLLIFSAFVGAYLFRIFQSRQNSRVV